MNLDGINLFNLSAIQKLFTPIDINFVPGNLGGAIGDAIQSIGNIGETVSAVVFCPIHFTELQTILLTVFLVIFSINLALIGVYWQKYGGVITDRFIRPSKCATVYVQCACGCRHPKKRIRTDIDSSMY